MDVTRQLEQLVSQLDTRQRGLAARGGETIPFAVRVRDGPRRCIPSSNGAEPAFTIVIYEPSALRALQSMDVSRVGEAFLRGALDVEGELWQAMALRDMLSDRRQLGRAWHYVRPLLRGRVPDDKRIVARHYEQEADFFLYFLDQRHRCYSHGVFERDDEDLEPGITRKLEFSLDAAGIGPGDRVLDVGGGWGAFTEFAGCRGVHVTSLTISERSERFMADLVAREGLPCRVVREHLYEHRAERPYDAIVIMGVTEHLPDYPGTLAVCERLLKPGGRVYVDASAARRRYDLSSFLLRHIFPGSGSPMVLHQYLAAVARSRFSVTAVYNDRHNYLLTAKHWAQRLDRNRELIERRWGAELYRIWRLYLWGCVDGFTRDAIQAYRVVLQLA
jgi:cyclopropane-fatty-acyl-phospholipid synthase